MQFGASDQAARVCAFILRFFISLSERELQKAVEVLFILLRGQLFLAPSALLTDGRSFIYVK